MHDYVKTLGAAIRGAHEKQGVPRAPLVEKLGIDVRATINTEDSCGNSKFEVLYSLVTTLRIPVNCISHPGTDSMGNSGQQLFWELHSLSGKEALELFLAIRCPVEMVHKHGPENS